MGQSRTEAIEVPNSTKSAFTTSIALLLTVFTLFHAFHPQLLQLSPFSADMSVTGLESDRENPPGKAGTSTTPHNYRPPASPLPWISFLPITWLGRICCVWYGLILIFGWLSLWVCFISVSQSTLSITHGPCTSRPVAAVLSLQRCIV